AAPLAGRRAGGAGGVDSPPPPPPVPPITAAPGLPPQTTRGDPSPEAFREPVAVECAPRATRTQPRSGSRAVAPHQFSIAPSRDRRPVGWRRDSPARRRTSTRGGACTGLRARFPRRRREDPVAAPYSS